MKDEIKEIKKLIAIINCMKDSKLLDNGEYYKVHSDFIISLEENKTQLLNYITNLQEENERLNLELSGYRQAILNDDNLMGLKSRIDKAIKYINAGKTFDDIDVGKVVNKIQNDLLNILQGSDK